MPGPSPDDQPGDSQWPGDGSVADTKPEPIAPDPDTLTNPFTSTINHTLVGENNASRCRLTPLALIKELPEKFVIISGRRWSFLLVAGGFGYGQRGKTLVSRSAATVATARATPLVATPIDECEAEHGEENHSEGAQSKGDHPG